MPATECVKALDASQTLYFLHSPHLVLMSWLAAVKSLRSCSSGGNESRKKDCRSDISPRVTYVPFSISFIASDAFVLWKSGIILIRVMMIMPSLIKVMEVIMTGIITQLAMEAIICIAV